jgi:hypothetical protein
MLTDIVYTVAAGDDPMARDKMVRVSEKELRLLREAKKAVQRRGYASIEEFLEEQLEEESEDDEDEDLGDLLAGFALGAIAALGAAAIIRILSDSGKGGSQR